MNIIKLGPLLLNVQLLIFIGSAVIAYLAIKYRIRKVGIDKNAADRFVNALILGFLTWKFSLIIFDPIAVIQHPSSLLYFSGGDRGLWLAIVISILYLWIRVRKDGASIRTNLDVLFTGWLAGSSMYHSLLLLVDVTNVLYHLLYILLAVGLLLFLCLNKQEVGNLADLNQLLIWYSLGMIGITFMDKKRDYFFLSFSIEQILFFIIFIMTLVVGSAFEKKQNL